jgi:hypothetical protein
MRSVVGVHATKAYEPAPQVLQALQLRLVDGVQAWLKNVPVVQVPSVQLVQNRSAVAVHGTAS